MVTLRSGAKTLATGRPNSTGTASNRTALKNGILQHSLKEDDSVSAKNVQLITFISLVIDLLGFTVVLPLFPALLDYYSKNDSSGLFHMMQSGVENIQRFLNVPKEYNSVLFGGILGSLFSFLQFLSSPICGALSDVYGRKPLLICTMFGIAISYGLWALASNFMIFVLARIIGGLSKGNVSLSYSVMTDILDPSSRSKGMALIGVAFSIGFIIGPVVGVGFSKWGSSGWFAASAFYALSLAILNILFVSAFFPETLPVSKRKKNLESELKETSNFLSPSRLFAFKAVRSIEAKERESLMHLAHIYFLYLFLYSGLEFTITFVTHHHHGFDSMAQGQMFMYLGIIMSVVQGGFVRKIKLGQEKQVAIVGLMLMAPSFILFGFSTTRTTLYVALTLYAVGASLIVTCLTAMASICGPVSEKGTMMGIWRSLGALARASGPVVACIGFWCLGRTWIYCIGGCFLLVPIFMLRRH